MSNVRSSPIASRSSTVSKHYRRGRAAAGLTMFILLWSALWFLNGYFTARSVVTLAGYYGYSAGWGIGWLAHLAMTVIELSVAFITPYLKGVPFFVLALIWLVAIPFGVFDVGSSALGLLNLFAVSLPVEVLSAIVSTIVAMGIAIAPEPVIMWLIIALVRLLRD